MYLTAAVRSLALFAILALSGCQGAPVAPSSRSSAGQASAPATKKILTVAALASYKGFGPQYVTTTGGGSRQLNEIHSIGFFTTDNGGTVIPRLLREMPRIENGDVVVAPDGRMETTFRLRPDVRWQDGAPFTAADMLLGWQVATDPRLDVRISPAVRQMESVQVVDQLSVRVTWKTTYFHALEFSVNEWWPLPSHLLADGLAGDPEAFLRLPYWNAEYVHLGPFRLTNFGLGENLSFQRFDDYFLGKPKLDEVRIRIVPDNTVVYASLLAGAIDLAGGGTLSTESALQLRDEWAPSGKGAVISKQGNLFFVHAQFNVDYQRIPELRESAAVRRGLLQAVDREGLRQTMLPGVPGTEATGFMTAGDPRVRAAGTPFARFVYDQRAALEQFATVGWQRGADRRLLSQTGEQVALPFRINPGIAPQIIAQDWRELGFQVDEENIPGSLLFDREYRVTFPGLEYSAQGNNEGVLARFDSRNCPRPPRFQGAPDGCYQNPSFDALVDRLYGTLDTAAQGQVLREIGEFLATELPFMPMIYQVSFAAVPKHVRALTDDFVGAGDSGAGQESRNAHLWDRD